MDDFDRKNAGSLAQSNAANPFLAAEQGHITAAGEKWVVTAPEKAEYDNKFYSLQVLLFVLVSFEINLFELHDGKVSVIIFAKCLVFPTTNKSISLNIKQNFREPGFVSKGAGNWCGRKVLFFLRRMVASWLQ